MKDLNDIGYRFIHSQLFGTNDIDEASSTIIYIGTESFEGDWRIKKIDTSIGVNFTYATEKNNSDYNNYTDAWTARASLTYQDYKDS